MGRKLEAGDWPGGISNAAGARSSVWCFPAPRLLRRDGAPPSALWAERALSPELLRAPPGSLRLASSARVGQHPTGWGRGGARNEKGGGASPPLRGVDWLLGSSREGADPGPQLQDGLVALPWGPGVLAQDSCALARAGRSSVGATPPLLCLGQGHHRGWAWWEGTAQTPSSLWMLEMPPSAQTGVGTLT